MIVKVDTQQVSGLIGIIELPTLREFVKLLTRVNQLEARLAELDTRTVGSIHVGPTQQHEDPDQQTIDRIRAAFQDRDLLNITD